MALSLPEHLATQEATGHGKMRVDCTYFSVCSATSEIRTRRVPVTAQRLLQQELEGLLLRF